MKNKLKVKKNFLNSNIEWEKWGENDPLYGVSTWPGKEKGSQNPWSNEDFYKTGEQDWSDFSNHWVQYGLSKINCLEIGCGAGRITKQLSKYFKNVYAIDVSQGMIDYAKNNLSLKNVTYTKISGNKIDMDSESINAVFSTDVFQHFDNNFYAEEYFKEIFRVMRKDSTLMIHLKVFKWPFQSRILKVRLKLYEYIKKIISQIERKKISAGQSRKFMVKISYEQDWLFSTLNKIGFKQTELKSFQITKDGTLYTFVFAKK